MKRRAFLASTALAGALPAAGQSPPLRAAVIGHTGRGDYGHGLEKIFTGREGIELVGLADPDPAGRERTARAIGAPRAYASWRDLLAAERPDLVSVGMRHADQHAEIITACLAAGAHVYAEKPLARDPAECDAILAAAAAAKRRVAVAHTTRTAHLVRVLRRAVTEGLIGDLVTMHGFGKQDHRAGGEDLMVLGSHIMDLMRCFAGDPLWCSARVLVDGRDATAADARLVADNVGPVAGNEVFAHFAFPAGINATFTSSARLRAVTGFWGLDLVGTKRSVRIHMDADPNVFVREPEAWVPRQGATAVWRPLDPGILAGPPPAPVNAVGDWLAAVREDREPECSLRNAAWAVEMVVAVHQAALAQRRVAFPLADRRHPLKAG